MSAITVGNIRLAAGSDKNSVLYNAYHLLTQISALYAHFSLYVQSYDHKMVILSFGDEVVSDIGDFYLVWEGLDKTVEEAIPSGKELAVLMVHTCQQFAKIIELSNEWTSYGKMTSLLLLSERRWRRLLTKLLLGAGKEGSVLNELKTRCEDRGQRLARELQKSKVFDRQTQNAFDVADHSLLEKSFGF